MMSNNVLLTPPPFAAAERRPNRYCALINADLDCSSEVE